MTLNGNSSFRRMIYLLTLGLSMIPGPAAAQSIAPNMEGSFTLSSPVQWETTVLPPGSYWISLDGAYTASPFTIVKIGSGKRTVASFISQAHSEDSSSMKNVLTLERSGKTAVVRSLDLPEFGAVFYYPAPKSTTLIEPAPTAAAGAATLSPGN